MSVFDDLVGQERAAESLREAAAGRGMTHAWLFTGPPGSGRSVAARTFAAALLCADGGCGDCPACRQVAAGSHPDVEIVRPAGLSYGVRETRRLVLRAAGAPTVGAWRIVLFEDADRTTEQAANALLKAIEEPPPRTVWLLCAPSPDDLVTTIRSRCRLITLRTPPPEAIADVLVKRDGADPETAAFAARAASGHIGRARHLALDEESRRRRNDVLSLPMELVRIDRSIAAAERLVKAAEAEAKAATERLNEKETTDLRQAYGEGAEGQGLGRGKNKGLARGAAGALKELEDRQKSRATRIKRDSLDLALLDLAGFYRDVLALQFQSGVTLANEDRRQDLERLAASGTAETTLRHLEAIMLCRERLAANANPQIAVEAMTVSLQGPVRRPA